jgi:PAS domain S-box-containing protein
MSQDDPSQPPVLPDETGRLAALRALGVIDTPAEPSLDVITRLAADRFDAEISLVSLVEERRQWFKSRFGLESSETPRAQSFCAHAIASDAVMVVADATADPRFAANPLVTGAPFIRFYAAAPLITSSGHRIGTLCVIDSKPRAGFSARDAAALQLMAGQVMAFLEQVRMRQEQRIAQLIAETTTDAFVCSDPHSRIIHWNRAAEAMFGWRAEEVLGQPMHMIIPDRHRHGHDTGMARLRARGPTRLVGKTVEVPAVCRAGAEFPVELSLGMWPAEGHGDPEGFAAIIRDVSARKALENQRAATEARLAQQIAAIEASDDGIAVTDAAGHFIFMNRAHATMFGHESADALIGQPWRVLYDEANARLIGEIAMPVLAQTGRWRGEAQGRRADGGVVDQEVSLSLAADGGLVCVTRDIGGRLAMEREKARLREQLMLAQRQEAVGQLASGIAHDFNNLIAAIAGTASLLERIEDDLVRRHALRIQSAAATATGLVDKLLALGRRAPDLKPVDLRAILTSVRDLVAPSLADPQHRIEVDLPAAPMLARADDTEVMQVFLNLALNARDALPAGQRGQINLSLLDAAGHPPVGAVMVGAIPKGPAALIRVTDSGCGILAEDIGQVFEPFYTRKGDAGTGLGLAVVAGIVANAGGAIALFSRQGSGSIFEIWWPLQSQAERAGAPAIDGAADAEVLAGKAVLVVDDNPAVVETLVAMLEQAGAEPGPCLDPADALAAVEEDPQAWNLVITDYDMPGMNGAALAQALRAIRADLPLMLLSAVPRAHQRRTGDAELFDAILAKPAGMDALVAAARTAMANARARIA